MLKNVLASKTVWLNIITLIVLLLMTSEFQAVVPPHYLPLVVVLNTFLNLILRIFFTSQPLTSVAQNSNS